MGMGRLIVKHGAAFVVSGPDGMLAGEEAPSGRGDGFYLADTCFVSGWRWTVDGRHPVPLLGEETDCGAAFVLAGDGGKAGRYLPSHSLTVSIRRSVHWGRWTEGVMVRNWDAHPRRLRLELHLTVPFADIFDVRAGRVCTRGLVEPPDVSEDRSRVEFPYRGSDGYRRSLHLLFDPAPAHLHVRGPQAGGQAAQLTATWTPELRHGGGWPLTVSLWAEAEGFRVWESPLHVHPGRNWPCELALVRTGSERWNRALERAAADILMLLTDFGHGPVPVAGLPWYGTLFGRDALLTCLMLLPFGADLARSCLVTLAEYQGTSTDPAREEAPGKIPHELRWGELANTGVVPFGRYYGSVDATPLFVLLAAEYWAATADVPVMRHLWPHVLAALEWMDTAGDPDGDGFLEYVPTGTGLRNQSWKDSPAAMCHPSGEPASPPIAVAEVQGYAYRARLLLGQLLCRRGHQVMQPDRAAALGERLLRQAHELRARFDRHFWVPEPRVPGTRGFYALALDGRKRPVAVLNSNMGQCLWTGIVPPGRARQVVRNLLSPALFSGWGIRTLGPDSALFNPLSYHNGSVWPHDTALAVLGMARYGFREEARRVIAALMDALDHLPGGRFPELFAGFDRDTGRRPGPHRRWAPISPEPHPVPYPDSCSPQAWSAAVPFALISALLGLGHRIDAPDGEPSLVVDPSLGPPPGADPGSVEIYPMWDGREFRTLRVPAG